MSLRFSRRQFLKSGLAALGTLSVAGFFFRETRPREIPGAIVGANFRLGHRLRHGGFPPVTRHERAGIAIIGGGIAGLSAGWRLKRRGFEDFRVLDLEDATGGNARSGENAISAYPWGAHYVPLPGPALAYVRELFEELGVIEGYDAKGRPRYNELYLCAAPQERLFALGRWQEGLLPQRGVTDADRREYASFFAAMEKFRSARGRDGRRAFELPVEESSSDPELRDLDKISFAQFLDERGWHSKALRWYLDYCCRDDYGTRLDEVSAWAGIHYFAARNGTDGETEGTVLTWPEGNGWIAKRLAEKIAARITTKALAHRVQITERGALVDYYDAARNESVRLECDGVVLAAPRFIAGRLLEKETSKAFTYAPWMVANVSLREHPSGRGVPLAWDNVLYESEGLGYVVATHQDLRLMRKPTVLTYYRPLCREAPDVERKQALARDFAKWREIILADLERAHPEIRNLVTNVDVWLWGHAMIRPVTGFLWGEERRKPLDLPPQVQLAHSDMSGLSLFEEAQYRGVKAADALLASLGRRLG